MIRLSSAGALMLVAAFSLNPLAARAQSPAVPAAPAGPVLSKDAQTRLEQHNKQLHDQLGITAAQQPQWDQFVAVTRSNAADMHRAFSDRGDKMATMTAADNMESYAALAQLHAANMQKTATAFQTLYAALSPQQKEAADRLFRARMERRAAKR